MPNYRRFYDGRCWFFTVVTHSRRPLFADPFACDCLSLALRDCRDRFPFSIDAMVLLPDHLHTVWTLPDDDLDFSRRWSVIKRRFTQNYRAAGARGTPYWQPRFWAHCVLTDEDYRHHVDYVHINPLKHGLCSSVSAWQWSSFHRYVREGVYPLDWGGGLVLPGDVGNE
jgi:putative transposase